MVALFSYSASSIAAVLILLKESYDPDPAPLSLISHPLASTYRVATICEITSVYSFTQSRSIYRRSKNLKNSAPGPNQSRPFWGFGHLWDGNCQDLSAYRI